MRKIPFKTKQGGLPTILSFIIVLAVASLFQSCICQAGISKQRKNTQSPEKMNGDHHDNRNPVAIGSGPNSFCP